MGPSAIVFGLAWLAAASPAPPMPAPSPLPPPGVALYALRYRTTAGCPTEDQMRADVSAHLRRGIRPSGVEIEIQLAGTAGRFTGQLLATDRFGAEDRQSLSGADCPEIARALAFLAGLAVELGERRQADLVSGAPPASPSSPPLPPSPPHAFRIGGRILAGVTGGLADGPSLLGEVGIAVEDTRPRLFAPAFVGALLVAGENQIDGRRGSAELSLLGGRVAGCPVRLSKSKAELRPCVGLTFGEVRGQATSLPNSPTVTEPWLSAEATLAVRWFLTSRILAEVEGGAVFPIERPAYAFAFQPADQPLYTVPRVTERIAAGVGFRF
jgi:hypothetical protein